MIISLICQCTYIMILHNVCASIQYSVCDFLLVMATMTMDVDEEKQTSCSAKHTIFRMIFLDVALTFIRLIYFTHFRFIIVPSIWRTLF